MKNPKFNVVLIVFFSLFIITPVKAHANTDVVIEKLDKIISSSKANIGIEITSLSKGDTIFKLNSDELMNPASVTKIVTAATALKYLEPDYRFRTRFFIDNKLPNGYVQTLFIKGEGDPSIVMEQLPKISEDVYKIGIRKIGGIVIDDTFFDSNDPPGITRRSYEDTIHTSAMSLDFNRLAITIAPGAKVGAPANITTDTGDSYIKINNQTTTVKQRRGGIQVVVPTKESSQSELNILVKGRISIKSRPQTTYRLVPSSPLLFGSTLKALLEQKGITVDGGIARGKVSTSAKPVLDELSKPLSIILQDMNKFSNNFIAEQILKVLGAKLHSTPGSTEKGVMVVKKYLSGLGIKESSYTLVNGSGLTYENRLSASQIIKILKDMYGDRKLWADFVESLSIAGIDGTIARRHKSPLLIGKMRAKTGTLAGVSTLAGVLPSANGEIIGFAILINKANAAISHGIQDQIVKVLAEFSR